MADITQNLGFDASQAIAAIAALDSKLRSLNTSLILASQGFSTFNKSSATSAAAVQQVGKASKKSATDTNKAAKSMTVSFQTLARVITTQLIVRAFGALQRGLKDSLDRAVEFQQTIAEIATIDIRGGPGFDAIAQDVLALSDAFGADLGDVGRGLYQTISNQIGNAGDAAVTSANQLQFLQDAIKFSVAGVTDTESAVNLLSGTINAFGLEAEDAGQLSAGFFKTIELGRTTASELAASFGTVATLAGQLGVSVEELQASFATVTIAGLDTAKAATQIRGALTALLKPTEAMKDAFEQLGVAGGEQLIDLFGFQGALEAVIGTTDESAESVAKLIPRVRGLSGVLRLASEEGAKAFRENLDSIINANQELLDEKFEIVFETDAKQFEINLNRLKNFLTNDFGQAAIKTVNDVVEAVGGLDTITEGLSAIGAAAQVTIPLLAALAVAAGVVGTQAALASSKVGLLGKSFAVLGAATAAIALGDFIGTQVTDALNADNDAIDKAHQLRLDNANKAADARQQIEESTNKLILADFKRYLAEIAQGNAENVRSAVRAADQIREANRSAFEGVIGASQELERQLRSSFQAREGQARRALSNIADAETDLRDARFDASTRSFNDTQKFFAAERLLAEENAKARTLLASKAVQSGDVDAIADVESQFARVRKLSEELTGLASSADAERGGSPFFAFRADNTAIDSIQQVIDLNKELGRIVAERAKIEKAAADAVAENNRKLKSTFTELIKVQDSVFEKGLNTDEQQRRIDEFSALRNEFFDLLKSNADIGASELADFSNVLGRAGFGGIVEDSLSEVQLNQLSISQSALEGARQQLTDAIQGAAVEVSVDLVVALRGVGIEGDLTLDRIRDSVVSNFQDNEIVNQAKREVDLLETEIASIVEKVQPLSELVEARLGRGTGTFAFAERITGGDAVKAALDNFNTDAIAAFGDGSLSQEELNRLQEGVNAVAAAFDGLRGPIQRTLTAIGFQDELRIMNQFTTGINETTDATAELTNKQRELSAIIQSVQSADPEARQNLIDAAQATGLRSAAARDAATQAGEESEAINDVGQAGINAAEQLGAIPLQIQSATDEVANLQTALNSLTAPQLNVGVGAVAAATGGGISRFSKGGAAYLAGGGFAPRGTDTIPAMLSPGEFVVNARSSRRFFSQLQAMNAGVQPIYRQEGGAVTNVGDINVSVNGSKEANGTGRTIARRIRRELRRGTSSL
jgi:TP901 family phage tail tape measure protein